MELDELDTITAPVGFYASSSATTTAFASPEPPNLRRSLRARPSLPLPTSLKNTRKRTFSTSSLQIVASKTVVKRAKLDDKKAQTEISSKKRDARDEARKKWLYCHRDVVEPMLPANSTFYDNLQKELEHRYHKDTISFKPMHGFDTQPKLIRAGQMKDYQLEGLSFLVAMYKNGMSCILGDEMGLGKTLQTLSLFAYIKENEPGMNDPHLVICPLSVLSSWETEAARWVPSLRVIRFHGIGNERERLKHSLRGDRNFDIMLTTYETFVAEDQWFKSGRWTYCVLDEGHKIKNSDTLISHKVQGLGCLYRLRTPVQNNLGELWGLLHWLLPTVFTQATQSRFIESFDIQHGTYSLPFLNGAKKLVSTIMLRRTKAVVAGDDVPPREELTVFIPLTELQRFWTYRLLTKLSSVDLQKIFAERGEPINLGNESIEEGGKTEILAQVQNQMDNRPFEGASMSPFTMIYPIDIDLNAAEYKQMMNLLIQLRQVCDHPYLLRDAEPEPYRIEESIVSASSKVMAIDKLLAELLPTGERVLIFSQWTGMLDILEDFMVLRRIPFARLDGSTRRPRRSLDIKLFQQEKSRKNCPSFLTFMLAHRDGYLAYKVFLISTKAGGLGINLTKASTVIMCDSDWNPQNDLQAIARAHRIGQTKVVKVYRLICQGSVEDQMLDRIRRKLFLSVKIMGSDNTTSTDNTSLGSRDLMDILRKGSSALSDADSKMPLEQFINARMADVLEHSKSLDQKRDAKIKSDLKVAAAEEGDEKLVLDAEEEERRLLSGIAQVQSRLFEGQVVGKQQSNAEIADEWRNLGKRAREDRTVRIGGMTFISTPIIETIAPPAAKVVKKVKKKFESEEWCNHCRDGGEVILCPRCPRGELLFFLANQGLTKAELRHPSASCSQHSCAECHRSTADCGGMLFRCRTCPQAFCEDCLPEGDLDAIGETLPELLLLDFGATTSAYYIKCHDCIADYAENPKTPFWAEWERDIRKAEETLAQRYAEEPRRARRQALKQPLNGYESRALLPEPLNSGQKTSWTCAPMVRAFSRLVPRRALLASSMAASAIVLHTPTEKLSIYPTPTPDILLVDEPSILEREIGVVRRKATAVFQDTHSRIQELVSRWIGVEHAIENRVKSIIAPNEPLTPGLLYVGVATLSGSILARNRILATRLLLPPLFLFLSAKHFIPQTTENLTSYLGSLEDTYFPTLAQKHAVANAHTQMTWDRLKDASKDGREWANRGAVTAVDKVQEATGLKLKETLGWHQAEIQRVEAKVSEAIKGVEQKAVEATVVVEKALDDTKTEAIKKVEEKKRLV
ncbi:hypothetical protein H0H93_011075 [Arthromyces matolae]|nr:hypothetical protein H0H93_011075 [Arthromyces matolae]